MHFPYYSVGENMYRREQNYTGYSGIRDEKANGQLNLLTIDRTYILKLERIFAHFPFGRNITEMILTNF